MLGTEVDLQLVENSVFAMEAVLKMWLQEQGGDREHLHLLLPNCLDSPIPGTDCVHKHISSALLASKRVMSFYICIYLSPL